MIADRDAEISRLRDIIAKDRVKSTLSASQTRVKRLEDEISLMKGNAKIPSADTVTAIIEQNESPETPWRKPGRPHKIDNDQVATIMTLKSKGYSIRRIAGSIGISVGAVHGILKAHEND